MWVGFDEAVVVRGTVATRCGLTEVLVTTVLPLNGKTFDCQRSEPIPGHWWDQKRSGCNKEKKKSIQSLTQEKHGEIEWENIQRGEKEGKSNEKKKPRK